jgi:hypothetical protein
MAKREVRRRYASALLNVTYDSSVQHAYILLLLLLMVTSIKPIAPSCGDSQPSMLQVVVGSIHIWKEALAALRVERHWHTQLAKSASLFFL